MEFRVKIDIVIIPNHKTFVTRFGGELCDTRINLSPPYIHFKSEKCRQTHTEWKRQFILFKVNPLFV